MIRLLEHRVGVEAEIDVVLRDGEALIAVRHGDGKVSARGGLRGLYRFAGFVYGHAAQVDAVHHDAVVKRIRVDQGGDLRLPFARGLLGGSFLSAPHEETGGSGHNDNGQYAQRGDKALL